MGNVVRLCDFERRSRSADACQPRDPADADVIVMPSRPRYDNAIEACWSLTEQMIIDFNVALREGWDLYRLR